ncbi:hypothetical protein [Roseovarius sp. 2305UL8-3]|uniref:hypothetical protein n=1 Tax=Roseovarius conchicola TaxID=3121636 RepID=UPI003529C798
MVSFVLACGLLGAAFVGGGLFMNAGPEARASQRPYPVVAVTCDADLRLCQALVQALSEMAPTHLYRINPKPHPPEAFDLRLDISAAGAAQLYWQDNKGEIVLRDGHNDAEFARHIVKASPGLAEALSGSR